jgi:hypothetical protein
MSVPAFPARKLALFALLSGADFCLTWHLLGRDQVDVYEKNPVAQWWLTHYGWLGLAGFKASALLLVALLGTLIYLRRPVTTHRLFGFGCVILTGVVLYSGYLEGMLAFRQHDPEVCAIAEHTRQIEDSIRRGTGYRAVMDQVSNDLLHRRCTLAEAVDRVSQTEKAQDPEWNELLSKLYPGLEERARLGANVLQHTVGHYRHTPALRPLVPRLAAEFRDLYQCELPPYLLADNLNGTAGMGLPGRGTFSSPRLRPQSVLQ